MPTTDIMIDNETLAVTADAVIISIGAVGFDPATGLLSQPMGARLSIDEQLRMGRKINESTLVWWMKQGGTAKTVFEENPEPVLSAITRLAVYIESCGPDVRVWGCGSDFDNAQLMHLYDQMHYPLPWKFWNSRCFRTLKELNKNIKRDLPPAVAHNAIADAVSQARHACKILKP
jgi:hypothetical protein